jgi:hypothetical protein
MSGRYRRAGPGVLGMTECNPADVLEMRGGEGGTQG